MTRQLAIAILLLSSSCWASGADENIAVTLKEKRTPVTNDSKRQGMEVVDRRLRMGNLDIRYHLVVDPKQGDRPMIERYGDYFLACEFPIGVWNWDREYFLDVSVSRPGGSPFVVSRASLQEGFYVLEQGKRGVADMVWHIQDARRKTEDAGHLSVRLVKPAADPNWFYMEIAQDGEPSAQISQVRLGAYPFVTTGPPERQRWASTLTNAYRLTDAPTPFQPATEWGVVLHNRHAHEEGGCLLVFDPDEVQSASVGGTYGVSVYLTPKTGSRTVHLALGYFWDTHYGQAVTQFRKEAAGTLQRLRQMVWATQLNKDQWQRERQEIERMLSHEEVKARFAKQWELLVTQAESILKNTSVQARDRGTERRFAVLLRQAQQLRGQLYDAALQALVREAMK